MSDYFCWGAFRLRRRKQQHLEKHQRMSVLRYFLVYYTANFKKVTIALTQGRPVWKFVTFKVKLKVIKTLIEALFAHCQQTVSN